VAVTPDNGDVNTNGDKEVILKTPAGADLLGAALSAASLPVVVASDQAAFPINVVNGANTLAVNADGSIKTVPLVTPPAPSGATTVIQNDFSDVASTTGVDIDYVVTNLKTLTIQTLVAGAETTVGGSIVELFEDPNGTGTPLTRISSLFISGQSDNAPVNQSFVGDGTRRIILRRRGYSGSAREMFAQWIGFEETT